MPVVEKFPTTTTEIVAGWNNPANAYSNNAQYADSSTANAEQEYSGFGFSMNDTDVIEDVNVVVEFLLQINLNALDMFYTASADGNLRVWDGSTWKLYSIVQLTIGVIDTTGSISGADNLYTGRAIAVFDHVKTPAEVNSMKVRLQSAFLSDPNGTFTLQVDYVSVKVAYTPAPTAGVSLKPKIDPDLLKLSLRLNAVLLMQKLRHWRKPP